MLSKNSYLNFYLLSFLTGIFTYNVSLDLYMSIIVLLVLAILFLNFYVYIKKYFKFFIFVFFGFLTGVFVALFSFLNVEYKQQLISKYQDGNNHIIELSILDTLKIDNGKTSYKAKILNIDSVNIDNSIYSILLVPDNFKLSKGDIIGLKSDIKIIDNFDTFNYKNYMLSKNIYGKIYTNNVENIGDGGVSLLNVKLDKYKNYMLSVIYKIYPKDEAIFLGGILLGARESLDDDLKESFNNSGLTHFIAVSGFNITIIIIFLSFILKIFPSFLRVILITLGVICFTLLVGESAPVVRASIMGLIGYYILASGRKGNSLTVILLSSSIMVAFSPFILNWDVSFHLSFLAVLGILYTGDFFTRLFKFLPNFFSIREAFVLTMSAMVFTLPIMMFNFGYISLISPISNILVAWTIPFAMFFGFLSVLAYEVNIYLGYIIGYIDFLFLRYDMIMVRYFGSLESFLLKVDVGVYKNYLTALYFVVLGFLVLYFKTDKKEEQN